ncbi:hypothetical protein HETIRDRAFT_451314 [Heterobasidion irregulare TC 32-1]|uniref:Uncharacterized protein n=1 Tax=Heterobasidion irregulare (strain TC 32-1) TaxID=747525 RepID=W4K6W7_HETIT|nr:uncharacterized protein HETIRDRAFT_451314 [Heterobasidion irregulare TC 32-1]ETW81553.1 hypothetical protein HETIRDRAFT_451314 [Heterobasidion irregulare TC 32-1]
MASPLEVVYMPPANPSPQVQRVLRWAETFSSFERNVGAHFADDVEYHVLPRALQRPVVTRRRACEEGFERQRSLFNFVIHDLVESGSMISVHVSSYGTGANGTLYTNEYFFTFYFRPGGQWEDGLPKIAVVHEFVDSLSTERRAAGGT